MTELQRERPPLRNALLGALSVEVFRSGADLARELGISRAAVWKQLEGLTSAGLGLERVRGRGYRLLHPVELLDARQIRQAMGSELADRLTLDIWDRVDSTNQRLDAWRDVPGPVACLAEAQLSGRGRRGRQWQSAYGAGIPLSLRWPFQTLDASLMGLAPAVSVSLARALESLGAEPPGLKWPNDLVCRDGKLAGILIELRGEPAGPCDVIIGLGVNWVAPWQSTDQPTAGLERLFPAGVPSRNKLVGEILRQLAGDLEVFSRQGFAAFAEAWAARDGLAGAPVTLALGHETRQGRALGLDKEGALRLQAADGAIEIWQVGEVSVRRAEVDGPGGGG
ncbi:BirA family biotin operon repressor/biotin-[acetyl-CoA-carboxylase] ligase [Natronospira proteinivora]|uniref:Bifunctional ligase/repressor BirA n=1 Tax=Natronospira proteinivora TaxID=1807133 RepID=A0ABT1GB28_9GAMM|nr:biotin--[acetyl-CoA-carboxylase] ligase [Natronospira proteinivora]MCP1728499.1 BirA family biotin operon repressor/biotin-[acetyl-CoA-carboxylase] ligase [Natronospira proteinivora]